MFSDRLELTLTLSIAGRVFTLPAGCVRDVAVSAKAWGFEGSAAFVVSSEIEEDTLLAAFETRDRIDVKIAIRTRPLDNPEDTSDRKVSFSGIAIDRRIVETVTDELTGSPILERRYELTVRDALAFLWSAHRPLDLLANASMTDILERHTPAGTTLDIDLPRFEEKQDVFFVPLHGEAPASFYDFVVGFVDETGGVLEHAATAGTYRIGAKKKKPKTVTTIGPEELGALCLLPREPRRHSSRVLNHWADGTKKELVPNTLAVTGVRRDVVAYTFVTAPFTRAVAREKARLTEGEHDIAVTLQKCPDRLPAPGEGAGISEELGDTRYSSKKTYRVTTLDLHARGPTNEEATLEDVTATFDLDVTIGAELASEPLPRLPGFRRTHTPILVEGRVLSASGDDDDRTFFVGANDSTNAWQLRCHIPLWNVDIVVPFEPGFFPGHFFFPPYKGQRVLVALERDRAKIHAYLDWAANGRTPMSAQGNRMALGYRDGNGTTVDHSYVDAKPQLVIERKLAGDFERVEMRENTVFFHVEEKPIVTASEPKFDISPKVEAAKLRVSSEVDASITQVTGKFDSSAAAVSATIETAAADVDAALGDAETKLSGQIAAVRADLVAMSELATGAPAVLAAAAAEAKAEIEAALLG